VYENAHRNSIGSVKRFKSYSNFYFLLLNSVWQLAAFAPFMDFGGHLKSFEPRQHFVP
jgi:hypothetical protein